MKCKHCKNEIPVGSLFCMFCGKPTLAEKKKKAEIKVPTPTQLPSGSWFARVTYEGQRIPVTAPTEAEWYVKAKAVKTGMITEAKKPKKRTLQQCIDNYIEKRTAVLSPATILGYKRIANNRFANFMDKDVHEIDYQKMINLESPTVSAKTLKNSWGLVSSAIKEEGIHVTVALPQVVLKDAEWLDERQINAFLTAIKGDAAEMAALLALHGLRRAEVFAVTKGDIRGGFIYVEGTMVISEAGFILRDTNKNQGSRRKVPIMIPRLQELIDQVDGPSETLLVNMSPNWLWDRIQVIIKKPVCKKAGIESLNVHALRKSFASLAYRAGLSERELMQLGGWSDYQTMHKIYIQLSSGQLELAGEKLKKQIDDEIARAAEASE